MFSRAYNQALANKSNKTRKVEGYKFPRRGRPFKMD